RGLSQQVEGSQLARRHAGPERKPCELVIAVVADNFINQPFDVTSIMTDKQRQNAVDHDRPEIGEAAITDRDALCAVGRPQPDKELSPAPEEIGPLYRCAFADALAEPQEVLSGRGDFIPEDNPSPGRPSRPAKSQHFPQTEHAAAHACCLSRK